MHVSPNSLFMLAGLVWIMGPTADSKVNTSTIRVRKMEQLSIWDGEEDNTKSMRDVWPFKET